jgi:hypothetical protein
MDTLLLLAIGLLIVAAIGMFATTGGVDSRDDFDGLDDERARFLTGRPYAR